MNNFSIMLLLFSFFYFQNSTSQEPSTWFRIDCGADTSSVGPNLLEWKTDEKFIQSGINQKLPDQQQPLDEMTTLRYFPYRTPPNCYVIPAYRETRQYIIRAGFYYGNYNSVSYPPTFDLHINDQKLSTVNTSAIGGTVYVEGIYVTHGADSYSVCLVQIKDGEIAFISSLEIMPLWNHLYSLMEDNATFTLLTRVNFGGDQVWYNGPLSDEKYNRIWRKGETPPDCIKVETVPDSNPASVENNPPVSVLIDSIQSNGSHPIILTVDVPQETPQLAYLVFYFTDILIKPALNDTRIIDIYINGQMMHTVATEVVKCKVVTLYPVPVVGPTIKITLAKSKLSTLPPIISAMEVFVRPDPSQAPGSNSTNGAVKYFFANYVVLLHVFCVFYIFIHR